MNLTELQALFWQAVREDTPPVSLSDAFLARGALGSTARMEIYHSAYWARHERCLKDSYPQLLAELGEQTFRKLTAHYIATHPSQSPCIEHAGRALPCHLRAHATALGIEAWLAELAELEWARIAAWISAEPSRKLTRSELAAHATTRPLRTDPSLQLVHVHARAFAQLRGAAPADASAWIVFWRADTAIRWLELASDEWRALARARAGATLAGACAHFEGADAGERAATALRAWLRRGWLVSWETCDESA